ncbi:MAG: translocation/assembly module TamB domain-containing protein [Bacteroidetes bacterium]|nr:translocation/assembly module TamB domain-containing protein [Bacteroidota bacterium]
MIRKVLRIITGLLLTVLLLLVFLVVAIRFPAVQSFVVNRAASYLSKELKTTVSIGSVDFQLFRNFIIRDLYVEDEKRDTLAYIPVIEAKASVFSIADSRFVFDNVTLADGVINVKRFKERKGLNLDIITDYFAGGDTDTSSKSKVDFRLQRIQLANMRFHYRDLRHDGHTPCVDFDDIRIDSLFVDADHFNFDDSTTFHVNNISLKEHKGFRISGFKSNTVIKDNEFTCNNLQIISPQSNVAGQLTFLFNDWEDFDDFIDSVNIRSSFANTVVSSNDIQYFAKELFGLDKSVTFEGTVKGKVPNLRGKNIKITYGNQSLIAGNISLNGLPEIEETYVDADLKNLVLSYDDVARIPSYPFLEKKKLEIPSWLVPLGTVNFKGKFIGYLQDFVTYGTIKTKIGTIVADVNLKTGTSLERYSGNIQAVDFDLGKMFDASNVIGATSFNCKIDGQSFDIEKVNGKIEGQVDYIDIYGYRYSNLEVAGDASKKLFNGAVSINEENISLDFNGKVDFTSETPQYNFNADVAQLKPVALQLFKRDPTSAFSGNVTLNARGKNIDDVIGSIQISDFTYSEKEKLIIADNILFNSEMENGLYNISLNSDVANAKFRNVRKLSTVFITLYNTITNYVPTIKPIPNKGEKENCQFEIVAKNPQPVLDIFAPSIKLAPNATALGNVNTHTNEVNINAYGDVFQIDDNRFEDIKISGNSKEGRFYFTSTIGNLFLRDSLPIDHITIAGQSDNKSSFIDCRIHDFDTATNKLLLAFDTEFLDGGIANITINPSSLIKVDTLIWKVAKENKIKYSQAGWLFEMVELKNNYNHMLRLDGVINSDPENSLKLNFNDFDVAPLNKILYAYDLQFGGIITGRVDLFSLAAKPRLDGDIQIRNFSFFNDSVGDAHVLADYDSNKDKVNLKGEVLRNGDSSIAFNGFYQISERSDFLDFDIRVQKLNLSALQHYFKGIVSDLRGKGSGKLRLYGDPAEPFITGNALLQKASFKVDYLGTRYSLSDDIDFKEDYIGFDNVKLNDINGSEAIVDGKLYHRFFDNMSFDLNINAKKFQMLNTTIKENDLYYGEAYGTGKVKVGGTPDLMRMELTMKTERVSPKIFTKINMPLSSPEEISNDEYITFINKNPATNVVQANAKRIPVKIEGFDLDFNITANTEAEINLIFDEKVGDVITGRGNGNIKMSISPDGLFYMFGDYNITQGKYFFSMQNLVGKPFEIVSGSNIRWNGNPYDASIDIKARYEKMVGLYDLLQDTASFRSRQNVYVILNLKNKLFSPEVSFDIEVPGADANLESLIRRYINTEDEKNRQAMSILFLNKFSVPEDIKQTQGSTLISNTTNASSSLTEFLSKQLSDWVSSLGREVDLDINLNYTQGDAITPEQYNVLLQKIIE